MPEKSEIKRKDYKLQIQTEMDLNLAILLGQVS